MEMDSPVGPNALDAQAIVGKPLDYELIDFHSSRPGHDLRYALKDTKLGSLGFEYKVSFDESLRRTVWWTFTNKRWLE